MVEIVAKAEFIGNKFPLGARGAKRRSPSSPGWMAGGMVGD